MKVLRLFLALVLLAVLAIAVNWLLIPSHNTAVTHFDTLIVLGSPTTLKGNPSATQRERVFEAVREYKAGVAPEIIFTGGAAHNRFVEADTMAALAIKQGVPASSVIEEPQALNTIQNLYFASQIMHAHGWSSAEVISSSPHLGRAALILQALAKAHPDLAIQWRTHASPWPREIRRIQKIANTCLETTRCLQIRIFGFPKSPILP